MKRLLTICMILSVASCATKPDNPDEPRVPQPHKGGEMTIYLNQVNFNEAIENAESVEGLQRSFLDTTGFAPRDVTGQARLIFDGLESIFAESRSGEIPEKAPYGTHPECEEAYSEKYKWHVDNNGKVPPSFGKIIRYDLDPIKNSEYWTGTIDLCTWIGSDNYYFIISFVKAGKNTLALKDYPFGGTIDDLNPDIIADFKYKLHAKGNGSVIYNKVYKNNVLYADTHFIYQELAKDCFDTFYINEPTGDQATDLADQVGYCMGRCDGIVLNTGK